MWANPNTQDNRKITASLVDTSKGHIRETDTQHNLNDHVYNDNNNYYYHNNHNYFYNSEVRFYIF